MAQANFLKRGGMNMPQQQALDAAQEAVAWAKAKGAGERETEMFLRDFFEALKGPDYGPGHVTLQLGKWGDIAPGGKIGVRSGRGRARIGVQE